MKRMHLWLDPSCVVFLPMLSGFMDGATLVQNVAPGAGGGLNGVATGAVKGTKGIYCDGSDDLVTISYNSFFASSVWTLLLWIARRNNSGGWERIFSFSNASTRDKFVGYDSTSQAIYAGYVDTGGADQGCGVVYDLGISGWPVQVGYTFDGTNIRLYVNGQLADTSGDKSGNPPRNSNYDFKLANDRSYYGMRADFGLAGYWTRALAAQEVRNHYAQTRRILGA